MRGAHLHGSARISRGHEIARTQGQRGTCGAENERSDLERLSTVSLRFSRGPSVQRRFSSCRHGLGFTRCNPRSFRTTNQRRNTARSRSFKKRRTRAAAQLRATNCDQSVQHGRAASAERAAPLWTARRNQIAARRRSARRSRFAALDAVRRRFTASAPALRVASLCHARRLRIRRIGITRNRRGLGETVAPQKWCGVKENRHALAFGKRAQKGETRWTHV